MKRPGSSSAFTLLELVLVLVIIALVVSLAAPSLAGFARSRAVSDAATTFVAMAQYARDRSKTDGQLYRLTIDLNSATCTITRDDGTGTGTFVAIADNNATPYILPDRIHISSDLPVNNNLQVIEFQPEGTCDTATIHFTNDDGNDVTVACLFPYDNYHIVTGQDAVGGAK